MSWFEQIIAWFESLFGGIVKTIPDDPKMHITSLFFKDSVKGWQGTWDYLANGTSERTRRECVAYLKSIGGTDITLLTNGQGLLNIYEGAFGASALNAITCQRIKDECERLVYEDRLRLFITLFSDADGGDANVNDDRMRRYLTDVHNLVGHLKPWYVLSIEANEIISVDRANRMADMMRGISGLPVGTHCAIKFDNPYFPNKMDFFLLEASWNPWKGNDFSPQKCADEYQWARNRTGKPCYWHEWNVTVTTPQCGAQRAKMRSVAGIWGVG